MRLVITLLFITFVFVQKISAQAQSFYRLYPDLDTNYSYGCALHFDSTGYFLLYSSEDAVLGNQYQSYIARYNISNTLQWVHPYYTGAEGNGTNSDLVLTSDSCLAYCGAITSQPQHGFIVKLNKQTGADVFLKSWGDTCLFYFRNLIETSDSGFIVIGSSDSLNTAGKLDLYIMKIDHAGTKQWDTILPLNNYSIVESSIIRINNIYYFTVIKNRNTDVSDTKLIGIKEDGTIVLNKNIVLATYGKYLGGIAKTKDNQLLLSGEKCDYYWPYGSGGAINDAPYGRMYVAKYDTLGNKIWDKEYFPLNIIQYSSEILSVPGGYILGGGCGWGWYYKGDGLNYNEPSSSFQDNFFMKITETGDSVWMRIYRNQDGVWGYNNVWASQDIMENMVLTPDGGIAATGWLYPISAISWEYKQYAWVLKTDSNGCGKPGVPYGLWREELPYNADSSIVHLTWLDDDATNIWHHVQGSKDGAWYFWELTPRPVTTNEFFDTVPKYHNYCYRVFGLDTTWARTCESAEICITTGINEYAPESGLLSVYPNPASDIIHCVLPENGDYEIVVYNGLGSIVHPSTEFIQRNAGLRMTIEDGVFQINISILPPGIYFIEARGEKVLRGKFVKE